MFSWDIQRQTPLWCFWCTKILSPILDYISEQVEKASLSPSPDDDLDIDFIHLLKKALGLLGAKKQMVDLVRTDWKSDRIEDLVDKCQKKSKVGSFAHDFTLLPKPAFQPSVAHMLNNFCGNNAAIWPANQIISQLTKMMQSLALSVRTLQTHVGQALLSKIPPNIS